MSLPELSQEEIARYSRHLILEDVGMTGQRKLKGSSVLCIGTGGLGSPLLLYLAAAGVGRIGIVDFDVVDESNLQRQIIHSTSTLGKSKVESAAARIAEVNPHVQVDVYNEMVDSENALRLFEPYDVIVDGTDNFPTRYLVNDACVMLGKPNVYGSIFKFEGQASVFNYQDGPHYRDLYPEPPPPGMVPSCAEGGVLGILPGVIGCIQATETIKILLGKGDTLSGRLLIYDALKMKFRELKLRKAPDRQPITELIDYQQFCGVAVGQEDLPSQGHGFERLSAKDAKAKLDGGWKPYILDVRKPHEAEIVKFDFADRLEPHEQIAGIANELPRDRDILIHCKLGGRSAQACTALKEAGFERLYNLEGGIVGWAKDVDPTMTTY
jgi:molybdopterin/thiamine biosynthesis adenylyltransferase/rhodanese-related sulfurtransferase